MKTASGRVIFQVSPLAGLLDGVYDGDLTVRELLEHGDLGLGTFNRLDGEMVVLDGVAYRARADGSVSVASGDAGIPFATVTFFSPLSALEIGGVANLESLEQTIGRAAGSPNLFYAIRLDGSFRRMKVRAVPAQSRPYPTLDAVAKTQPVFEYHDIEGTLAGFRCPAYFQGVNVAGWHLHFIDASRQRGGHVLDCGLACGAAHIQVSTSLRLELQPTGDFLKADLDPDKRDTVAAIRAAEKQ